MKKIDLYKVLISPIVTEKNTNLTEKQEQVVFKVLKQATKEDIKLAFEQAFDVKVATVRVNILKGKAKKFGRHAGKRADVKKAYIKLQPGQDFDLSSNQN